MHETRRSRFANLNSSVDWPRRLAAGLSTIACITRTTSELTSSAYGSAHPAVIRTAARRTPDPSSRRAICEKRQHSAFGSARACQIALIRAVFASPLYIRCAAIRHSPSPEKNSDSRVRRRRMDIPLRKQRGAQRTKVQIPAMLQVVRIKDWASTLRCKGAGSISRPSILRTVAPASARVLADVSPARIERRRSGLSKVPWLLTSMSTAPRDRVDSP